MIRTEKKKKKKKKRTEEKMWSCSFLEVGQF